MICARNSTEPRVLLRAHQTGGFDAETRRVHRVQFGEGFGDMLRQILRAAGAGHGVPLVADAAGIEHEGMLGVDRIGERRERAWRRNLRARSA